MKCSDCVANGACAYNIMLPYITESANVGDDSHSGKMVNIDKCLLPEILKLWEKGIKTTGCCCGHGLTDAFISVRPEFVRKMDLLRYMPMDYGKCTFKPKTILCYGDSDKGFNWNEEVTKSE